MVAGAMIFPEAMITRVPLIFSHCHAVWLWKAHGQGTESSPPAESASGKGVCLSIFMAGIGQDPLKSQTFAHKAGLLALAPQMANDEESQSLPGSHVFCTCHSYMACR